MQGCLRTELINGIESFRQAYAIVCEFMPCRFFYGLRTKKTMTRAKQLACDRSTYSVDVSVAAEPVSLKEDIRSATTIRTSAKIEGYDKKSFLEPVLCE